ncbi:protein ROS1C-like [Oryza brachyantha]|uniref:protein ROS1C-like n=1 Tax=Oryza brachyantha TaxID=4533 RepID=UPI001ADB967C|nr:protein ROS1C-like [Oryza brachyantha]
MDPSGLNPQASPAENQESSTSGVPVGRGTPNMGAGAAAMAVGSCSSSTLFPGSSLSSTALLHAMHEGSYPQAVSAGSMSGVVEQHAAPPVRPPYNLPAGCTQVPIGILVFHRRLTGRGSRRQLPQSRGFTPAPALSGASKGNLLSLGSASEVFAGDMATDRSELATPYGYNSEYSPTHFQSNGLYTEASKTKSETEASQLQQSAAALICDSRSKLKSVIPANTEKSQCQNPKESTDLAVEGSTDDNIHNYYQITKRAETKINHSDNTDLSTPSGSVCKEKTLTQIEIQIAGAEKTEAFNSKDTPAQKPKTRRKKHRPKVIREDRPAKMQKTTVTASKEKSLNQKPKRKYVRKKRNLSSLEKSAEPFSDHLVSREGTAVRSSISSVRRRLQFEFGEHGGQGNQSSMANSWYQNQEKPVNSQSSLCSVTKSSMQIEHAQQVHTVNSPEGLFFGINSKLNKILDEYIHLPEAAPKPTQEVPLAASDHVSKEIERKQDGVRHTHDPDSTSCNIERSGLIITEGNTKDLDLNYSYTDGFQMYCSASSLPVDSTKGHMTMMSKMDKNHTRYYGGESSLSGTQNSIIMRTAADMLAVYQACQIKKKRSARIRRNSFLSVMDLEKNTSQESTRLPQSCMEALYESSYIKFMTKKRSQKARLNSPNYIQPNRDQKNRFSSGTIFSGGLSASKRSEETFQQTLPRIPDDKRVNLDIHCELSGESSPNTSALPYMDYLQGVASKLKYLDLNTEQVHRTEMHLSQTMPSLSSLGATNCLANALVPYVGGVVVPYQTQFHLVKKQCPRAKVDLDFETTRVWNLLMGKAADPVDGTDVDKEMWWKQEREVFEGRANSFIARMRLVQGDRRFSPWKGSVVDSVVGVFLTQNVADHLSSSAYMALAASFPPGSVKSNCNDGIASQDNEIVNMSAGDKNTLEFFYNGSRPDIGISFEELSMACEKIHMESKDNPNVNELTKGENYSLHCKEPTGSFCNHETGIDHKAKLCLDFSSVEFTTSMKNLQGTQFQKEISLSQSVVTSESIIQPGLPLSSGMDHAPRNFISSISDAASQQVGSNFDDGKSLAGNEVTGNETKYQGIKTTTTNNCAVDEPGIPSDSNMYPFLSAIDCQLDERNETHVSSTSPNSSIGSASSNFKIGTIEENSSLFMPFDAHLAQRNGNMIVDRNLSSQLTSTELRVNLLHHDKRSNFEASELHDHESLYATGGAIPETATKADDSTLKSNFASFNGLPDTTAQTSKPKKSRATSKKNSENFDWDKLRRQACSNYQMKERIFDRRDSVDWEAVRCADVQRISHAIRERGMNNVLAERIQKFLNRLVSDHGSIDLEWLRDVPPDSAKDYLLSIRGLGLKSVECVRLLTLHHLAFPVDTNVGRICVRLGWVPIQPLPESLQLHLLELYPVLETIQKYLWPRLCKLDQQTLYELHYQMITFGKVFCTKSKPNCNACPMRSECKHFASAFASARLALPSPQDKRLVKLSNQFAFQNGTMTTPNSTPLLHLEGSMHATDVHANNMNPIIEEPASPKEETEILENDIEDFDENTDEIPTIKLNMEAFAQNLENCIKESNKDFQSDDIAKALVAISTEAASIPVPKLKNVHRLRTEHYVYEIPDSHPLTQQLGLDQREPDDPSPYLLAMWTPDELKDTSEAPKPCCYSKTEGGLCNNEMCHNCVSERENQSRYIRGTVLVPCRTAMRGSFPLNGTYFQVNEVFADHRSSHNPINIPREQIWNLQRRMVYFGTSVPTIFKGLTTEEIQQCFWRGFVCVRGFDMETRAPRPLCPHFHLAASKLRRSSKTAATEQTH